MGGNTVPSSVATHRSSTFCTRKYYQQQQYFLNHLSTLILLGILKYQKNNLTVLIRISVTWYILYPCHVTSFGRWCRCPAEDIMSRGMTKRRATGQCPLMFTENHVRVVLRKFSSFEGALKAIPCCFNFCLVL